MEDLKTGLEHTMFLDGKAISHKHHLLQPQFQS